MTEDEKVFYREFLIKHRAEIFAELNEVNKEIFSTIHRFKRSELAEMGWVNHAGFNGIYNALGGPSTGNGELLYNEKSHRLIRFFSDSGLVQTYPKEENPPAHFIKLMDCAERSYIVSVEHLKRYEKLDVPIW